MTQDPSIKHNRDQADQSPTSGGSKATDAGFRLSSLVNWSKLSPEAQVWLILFLSVLIIVLTGWIFVLNPIIVETQRRIVVTRVVTELASPNLVVFGLDAAAPYDQPVVGYQAQLIFFEVPANSFAVTDTLYVRIFDADTGGLSVWDTDQVHDGYNTTVRYMVYGSTGAYSDMRSRSPLTVPAGITSGTPLVTATIGISDSLDNAWYALGPFGVGQGEPVAGGYVFKPAVEGLGGKDGNGYRVALSTAPDEDVIPAEVRLFAFQWTLFTTPWSPPFLFPYVYRRGASGFYPDGFGCDFYGECLTIRMPLGTREACC